jgi:hypothetical protein
MPVPELKKLNQSSEDPQKKAALSSCIATEMKSGKSQEQATAMCIGMIDKQTGETPVTAPIPEGGM